VKKEDAVLRFEWRDIFRGVFGRKISSRKGSKMICKALISVNEPPMSTLKFNFHKPKQPATKPASPVKTNKTAFDDEDEEEQELPKIQEKKKKQPEAIVSLNEDLRSYTSYAEETSRRMAEKALEEDPSGILSASFEDSNG